MAEDAEARAQAMLANQKIDDHEDHCGERWREARDEMKAQRNSISKLHGRINGLIWAALLASLALAGFALMQWLLARGIAG